MTKPNYELPKAVRILVMSKEPISPASVALADREEFKKRTKALGEKMRKNPKKYRAQF